MEVGGEQKTKLGEGKEMNIRKQTYYIYESKSVHVLNSHAFDCPTERQLISAFKWAHARTGRCWSPTCVGNTFCSMIKQYAFLLDNSDSLQIEWSVYRLWKLKHFPAQPWLVSLLWHESLSLNNYPWCGDTEKTLLRYNMLATMRQCSFRLSPGPCFWQQIQLWQFISPGKCMPK